MAKKIEKPKVYCRDCIHATEDRKFENLSLDGKATLLICDIIKWPKRLITEVGCENFKHKQI